MHIASVWSLFCPNPCASRWKAWTKKRETLDWITQGAVFSVVLYSPHKSMWQLQKSECTQKSIGNLTEQGSNISSTNYDLRGSSSLVLHIKQMQSLSIFIWHNRDHEYKVKHGLWKLYTFGVLNLISVIIGIEIKMTIQKFHSISISTAAAKITTGF